MFCPTAIAAWLVVLSTSAPTADRAKAVLAEFKSEREAAAATFSADELKAADAVAARATATLADNPALAARLARDARWLIPFRPAGLPPHVGRVIGASRLRHADRVNAVAYSPDGTRLASASRDGTVRVWDLGNGREVAVYRGHIEAGAKAEDANVFRTAGAAFSPDGALVASCGGTEIHLWDPATGVRKHVLTGHAKPVVAVAFGKDANTLVSGGDDRTVIVWDVAAGKPAFASPPQTQRVEAVAVSADGSQVASVNAAGELTVYAPAGDKKQLLAVPVTEGNQAGYGVAFAGSVGVVTCGGDNKIKLTAAPAADGAGATLRTFTGHTGHVTALAAARDGRRFASGSADRTVRVWDVGTGKAEWTFQGHLKGVSAVAVRPDGGEVASGGEDGVIRLWPLTDADAHRPLTDAAGPLWAAAVSPDGATFATAGADHTIRIYDAATGKRLQALAGHKAAVTAVAYLAPGRIASAGGDRLVKVWNLAEGKAVDLSGHAAAVLAVAADPAGKLLVSGSADKSVKGWDAATGKALWTWAGKSAVASVAVRPDGKRVAVGTADGGLTVLSVAGDAAKVAAAVPAHQAGTACVAFSPDGGKLASCGGDGAVRVWTVPDAGPPTATAKLEAPGQGTSGTGPVAAVAFSPDGRFLAAGGKDHAVRIWDVRTGAEVRALRGATDWVTGVAYRPDGREVVAVSADAVARAFELDRPETAAPAGHTLPILGVAVSRDGKRLATASEDKTVKIWDLAAGRELATLSGWTDAVTAVGFTGPESVVGAGSRQDGRLRWWNLNPPAETRTAAVGGVAFLLTAAPDSSRAAVVWAKEDKAATFEVYPADGPSLAVSDKGQELTCAVLSADGTLGIAGGADGVLRVWDLAAKDHRGTDWPLFVKRVADLGLSADKKTLFAIDEEGTVKIADTAGRDVKATVKAMAGEVAGLVAAPNGDRFATLSADGEVKAWDADGKELRSWKLPTPPNVAAFTPDGQKLVTGNKDGTAYVLELP